MHHKLSIPNTLCSYSCNACIYFLSNSLRKGKAYSIQNHKINLRLIYFSTDQTHFFLTPYSWDLNLLMSQAIKMQWLILLFLKLTQSGCNIASTISWAAFSCTFCHTPYNHWRTQMECTGIPVATENLLKLWFEHTVFPNIKTTLSGHWKGTN